MFSERSTQLRDLSGCLCRVFGNSGSCNHHQPIGKYSSPMRLLVMMLLLMTAYVAHGAEQAFFDERALVDPTRPAGWQRNPVEVNSAEQRPEVRIDYIIHSNLRKMVSINGDHLQEGDRWQDVRVISIEAKKVLLAWRGQQWFSSITPNDGNNRNSMVIRRIK